MNRQFLEKPFEPAQIRQRKGRNGMLDYVEGHSVIQRLNEALESAWSFEIVHHEIREEEVLVLGRLTAEAITKMAFGASQVTRERESGKPVSLGDDLKAAGTDCLKKCATFLGVGLHLYAEKPLTGRGPVTRVGAPVPPRAAADAPPRPAPASPADPRRPAPAPVNGTRPAGGAGEPRPAAPATTRQLEAIHKVARAKGLDEQAVEHMSLRVFKRKLDALTQREAAALIKELSNLKRRVA
jgi:hypothetical protein